MTRRQNNSRSYLVETASNQYILRASPDGTGWIVWTADYKALIGIWSRFREARRALIRDEPTSWLEGGFHLRNPHRP
jgi:hypothetical protein